MNPPPLPTLNRALGRSVCPKQACWLVGGFFSHLVCAKIPAAVEFDVKVVKADGLMCWRASPDDTGLLQSHLKRFLLFFTEPNRSKGKSDYSLMNTSLGFLASKRITIKDRS